MDDVDAVMGACGSRSAVLFGYSEGGPMSILFAATYPERVTALILGACGARSSPAPDYPCLSDLDEKMNAFEELAEHRWGQGESIELYAPSLAGSIRARQGMARWERMAASPGALLRMLRMIRAIDIRGVLPSIGVETLVIQRQDDPIHPPCDGRYLAEHLPGARYFEQPGEHLLWLGDTDAMFAEIEQFLSAAHHSRDPDRVLATIMFAETPGHAAMATGPLDDYRAAVRRAVESYRGRLVGSAGNRILATFDGPGRAIRCAAAIRDHAGALAIAVHTSVHTGEIELRGDDIAGISLDIAAQVVALARPAEILVTRTVKDLVVGSGISFTGRGVHELGGIPDQWPLFAVAGL
jgi:class 3 adenylate cyclase